MHAQVLKLLPEIELIQDKDLRDKVVDVWAEAMAWRNWTNEELESIPFTLLADNVKIFFIEHVRTCCRMSVAVDDVLNDAYGERKTPVNRDFLIAGALLADVGKLLEFDKKADGSVFKSGFGEKLRHPFSGVGLAFKHGVPEEVLHVIAMHSKEATDGRRSPEAIIFHHVDFIDFDLVR